MRRVEPDRILLEKGEIPTPPGTVVVDCSGNGIPKQPLIPVFDAAKKRITIQVILCRRERSSVSSLGLNAPESLAIPDSWKDW